MINNKRFYSISLSIASHALCTCNFLSSLNNISGIYEENYMDGYNNNTIGVYRKEIINML